MTQDALTPILPAHINTKDHFWDAFGHNETEVSANWIVRLCQELGGWKPFSLEQLTTFYHRWRPANERFDFNRLIEPGVARSRDGAYSTGGGWVTLDDAGNYTVTVDFIARCYKSSPAKSVPAPNART